MDQPSNKPKKPQALQALWGAKDIGAVINKSRRETYYLLEAGRLPAQRIGRQWVSTRGQLKAWLRGELH